MSLRFKPTELQSFNWFYNISPCFPINGSKVNVIMDPRRFYDTLNERFKNARHRISIASLYIGTGELEKRLLDVTKHNLILNKQLKLNVLLDYQRGTRGEINSRTIIEELVNVAPDQCKMAMYQTPRLQGYWSKILPARYNEIVGLQHMKLYIADDSVIISGANCSNDYFQNRQDRYIEIEDGDLASFYCELIDEVTKFSKQDFVDINLVQNSKWTVVKDVNNNISKLIEKWKIKQKNKLAHSAEDATDTWVFPLVQMGEFDITQDEYATSKILASAPKGSYIHLATGYFNLTENYSNTLLKTCKANISLLMAHPNANGFMGAAGPAGGIPYAYSLIAKKFWEKVMNSNQTRRIHMLEYERPNWTFHAKGLWYYPSRSGRPWATVVGSANLGERSVKRDLEAQAAIFTSSPELQEKLHEECHNIHQYAAECSKALQGRQVPLWVQATVGLFRTYF
ncbi:CDP-diacylglycerol--glycerol-3-phosphate 3-phosphatidyltransferase, mitochondrial [Battus philenor]|uniref:CDP-diacylglycerol--glycerol-3-phosphate 3-phosphatidyltransferase, mitochondrial n=1 Tax=Battus philenor TaxID=42288 RepID=UPI0035CF51AA